MMMLINDDDDDHNDVNINNNNSINININIFLNLVASSLRRKAIDNSLLNISGHQQKRQPSDMFWRKQTAIHYILQSQPFRGRH